MVQVPLLIQAILILDTINSLRNVVLQKSDRTAKLSDTVEITDKRIVRINHILILILQGICISSLQYNGVNTKQSSLNRLTWCAYTHIFSERIIIYGNLSDEETVPNFKAIRRELRCILSCVKASGLCLRIFDCSC